MHFQLYTLFPEMFPGCLAHSIAGKALEKKLWSYETINIRDYATDKHAKVDAPPYGGGTGMVMRADVIAAALDQTLKKDALLLYPTPRGKKFDQNLAFRLAKQRNLAIVAGRFEGVDERLFQEYPIEEVSLGDFILSGGEIAALAMMDSCIRLLPGVISKKEAIEQESFGADQDYQALLEYPLYTEPRQWRGRDVPEVLLSGHHGNIAKWRLEQAKEITKQRRPDLWRQYEDKEL